jgi:mRNA interferase MazF
VLVVQSNDFNRSRIQTIVVAAITSNTSLAAAPGNIAVRPRSSGLPRESVVNVSQLLSLDRRLLTQRVKALDSRTMSLVDEGLRLVLSL